MKKLLLSTVFGISALSFSALAEKKIVNAHFSKESLVVQLQDSETGRSRWISSAKVGVINNTVKCTGVNCMATNLRIQKGSLYGDISLLNEATPSLKDVFMVNFYEDTLIDTKNLTLLELNGKYLIAIRIR